MMHKRGTPEILTLLLVVAGCADGTRTDNATSPQQGQPFTGGTTAGASGGLGGLGGANVGGASGAGAGGGIGGVGAGGTAGVGGAAGTTGGASGSAGAGGGAAAGSGSVPVDCSAIDAAWELCDSGPDFCAAVFTDGAGCAAVCAAAGLTCSEVWEDVDGECAADMGRAKLDCASEHDSDYCVCTGDGTAGNAGTGGDSGMTGGNAGTGGVGGDVDPEPPIVMDLCDPPSGATTVNATIVVGAGETFDGECARFIAGSSLGDGSQDENQDPVFRLEDGATLVNVVVGAPAADGIHTYGDVTLNNITWEDIGEDALTIKGEGTVVLDGGAAYEGEDKVFQINAESTFRLSNFRADNAGKLIRQNGGTEFEVIVHIDACDISNMGEAIFRTDSDSSSVTMTNTRYSNIGDGGADLWVGLDGRVTESGNTQY
jgi:hypothetical protein